MNENEENIHVMKPLWKNVTSVYASASSPKIRKKARENKVFLRGLNFAHLGVIRENKSQWKFGIALSAK